MTITVVRYNNTNILYIITNGASLVAQTVKNLPAMQETQVQSLGQEDFLQVHGNPLQYSCLENPMNRGDWWSIVHRIAELDTTEQLTPPLSIEREYSRGLITVSHQHLTSQMYLPTLAHFILRKNASSNNKVHNKIKL